MNLSTVIVCLLLAAAVALIIRHLVRNKKAGRTSCGCGCANCALSDKCHQVSPQNLASNCTGEGHYDVNAAPDRSL